MLWMIPRPIASVTSEAPPLLMNGRGIPVTGIRPMTMPTFTNSWNSSIDASPAPNRRPKGSRDAHAQARIRHRSAP